MPDVRAAVESLSTKIGGVLLVLGVVHLGNVYALSRVRRRRMQERQARPPVPPEAHTRVSPWAPPAPPESPA